MKTLLSTIFILSTISSFSITLEELQGTWISEKYACLSIENKTVTYEYGWYWNSEELKEHLGPDRDSTSAIFQDLLKQTKYAVYAGKGWIIKDTLKIDITPNKQNGITKMILRRLVLEMRDRKLYIKDLNSKNENLLVFRKVVKQRKYANQLTIKTKTYARFCLGKEIIKGIPQWGKGYKVELLLNGSILTATCTEFNQSFKIKVFKDDLRELQALISHIPKDLPEEYSGMLSDGIKTEVSVKMGEIDKNINTYIAPYIINHLSNTLQRIFRENLDKR